MSLAFGIAKRRTVRARATWWTTQRRRVHPKDRQLHVDVWRRRNATRVSGEQNARGTWRKVSRLLCHYTLCVRTEETRVLPFPLPSLLAPSVENRGNTERVSSEYTWNLEVEKWKLISVVVRIDFNTNESVSEAFLVTLASFSGN